MNYVPTSRPVPIADQIKAACAERNLTNEALGFMVGRTAEAVARWKRGESTPPEPMLRLLADVLEAPELLDHVW